MVLPDYNDSSNTIVHRIVPHLKANLVRQLDRSDLMPGTRAYLTSNAEGNRSFLLIAPIADKYRFDTDLRVHDQLCNLLDTEHGNGDRHTSCSKSGADGKHIYALLPAYETISLYDTLNLMPNDLIIHFVTDLSIALYWLHQQGVDITGPPSSPPHFLPENMLWQVAEWERGMRASINKLIRIASISASCSKKRQETPVFAKTAAQHIRFSWGQRLTIPLPVTIGCGDPWLDLVNHLLIFTDHNMPARELLINLYFNLNPPAAFFHTIFLTELQKHWKNWKKAKDEGLDTWAATEKIRDFANLYEGCSPIPIWFG